MSREQRSVLVAVILGTALLTIDLTIVTVALPRIGDDLPGADQSSLQWVIAGYATTFGALLQLGGSLTDVVGTKRVFLGGAVGFVVASVLCGAAWDITSLVAFRLVQGATAAVLFAAVMPTIARTFDGDARAAAIGKWSAVLGVAGVTAPLLGGLIAGSVGWRWMFFVNVPVGFVAIWLIARALPADDPPERFRWSRFDLLGAVLLGGALVALNLGLGWVQSDGWSGATPLTALAVAAVLLAAFVIRERTAAYPLVDLGLLRSRRFAPIAAMAMINRVGTVSGTVFAMFALQDGYGLSPLQVGVMLIPLGIASLVCAVWAGNAQARIDAKVLLRIGFAGLSVSAVGFAVSLWQHWPPIVLCVILVAWGGFNALANTPIMAVATTVVAPSKVGMATGMLNTFYPVGGVMGIAVLGSVYAAAVSASGGDLPAGAAACYVVVSVLMLLAAAVGGLLPDRAHRTPEKV